MTVLLDKAVDAEDERPRTTVVPRPEDPADAEEPQERRRLGGARREDRLALAGAAAAGLSTAALLFGELAPFTGAIGFVVVAYAVFLAVYALLVSSRRPARRSGTDWSPWCSARRPCCSSARWCSSSASPWSRAGTRCRTSTSSARTCRTRARWTR
ncbi:hypothetical protein ACFQZC_18725 [Streptacidiphilus monticola]